MDSILYLIWFLPLFYSCLRNCGQHDVIANSQEIIYLEARTVTGVGKDGTDKYNFSWICTELQNKQNLDVNPIKEDGHFPNQLVVQKNKLKPGQEYKFTVKGT